MMHPVLGQSFRWHPDGATTGLKSSPVIDTEIFPNGKIFATRQHTIELQELGVALPTW